jgi:hypothetical protein
MKRKKSTKSNKPAKKKKLELTHVFSNCPTEIIHIILGKLNIIDYYSCQQTSILFNVFNKHDIMNLVELHTLTNAVFNEDLESVECIFKVALSNHANAITYNDMDSIFKQDLDERMNKHQKTLSLDNVLPADQADVDILTNHVFKPMYDVKAKYQEMSVKYANKHGLTLMTVTPKNDYLYELQNNSQSDFLRYLQHFRVGMDDNGCSIC